MKVICDRGALVEALNLVSGVVVSRTPKPVLMCVKITAENNLLTLTATDLEVSVKVSTSRVEITTPGTAVLPADKLSSIVRESVDATVTIELEDDAAHIRGQDAHFKVFGMPVEDFPAIPQFSGEADFQINAGDLQKLISQTVFATARENSRYAINGVLLERESGKLCLVATDGRRLALAKGQCKAAKSDNRSAIIPTKALTLLLRVFTEPDQDVKVRVAENQILIAGESAMLASNLVEGNFPPYRDVIPRDGDKKAQLAVQALASGVRQAALLTTDDARGIRLSFKSDGLVLSSRAPEMGEAEVKVPMVKYEGEELDIAFNPVFILDVLKVVDTEQVSIDMKAPTKPGVIRCGNDFLYVIMPVNLQ